MQYLEFNSEEQEVLRDVLEHAIAEIDIEVFRTDTHDFKQMLKHRREILEGVLRKVSSASLRAAA